MADVSLPWGDQTLTVQLPADWTVQQTASPTLPPARPDWPEHLARALAQPEGTPPLAKLLAARRTRKIVLIVEDLTRHSPLPEVLKPIFRELDHARIPRENVEILFATGMHPPLRPAEVARKIGPELAASVSWRCNPWQDRDAYVSLERISVPGAGKVELLLDRGALSADLRILVSSVSPHLQAGFGGGFKMLVPGCAHGQTIRQLHRAAVPRELRQQVGQNGSANRMRRLIDAAGPVIEAAHGRTFGVQYLLDAADQVAAVAAGDVASCQRMLAKQCAAGCGIVVDAPADVVISNAFPRDFDLWQGFKTIVNTCWAVRDNGVLICLARCPGGIQMPTFHLPIPARWVRRVVRLLRANVLGSLLTRLVPRMAGDAAFFVRLAAQVVERIAVIMVAPAAVQAGWKMLGLPVVAGPAEAIAAAEEELGRGPKRVIVFPAGGISYPLLRQPGLTA